MPSVVNESEYHSHHHQESQHGEEIDLESLFLKRNTADLKTC
jgi:hypothetical protein